MNFLIIKYKIGHEYSWDEKTPALVLLLAKITDRQYYHDLMISFFNNYLPGNFLLYYFNSKKINKIIKNIKELFIFILYYIQKKIVKRIKK